MLTAIFVVICLIALALWGPIIFSLVVFLFSAAFQIVTLIVQAAMYLIGGAVWLCWLCVQPRKAMAAYRAAKPRGR